MNPITDKEVNKKQLNIINKAGYHFYEQLARIKPKKLYDCREEMSLCNENVGKIGMIKGRLISIESIVAKSGMDMTRAVVRSEKNNEDIGITWFHAKYPAEMYSSAVGNTVLVYGKIQADNFSYTRNYCMLNPIIFTDYPDTYDGKIIAAMKKYKGMSVEYFNEVIERANVLPLEEYFSDSIKDKYDLYSLKDLNTVLHNPENETELKKAFRQVDVEDLTYFAIKLIEGNKTQNKAPVLTKTSVFNKAISDLPFNLTDGQNEALNGLKNGIVNGSILNALVQGDVSCGKSIVAYLLMLLLMENGYQASLLAPTVVLASQHYKDAAKLFERYGFKTAFIHGGLKKKETESIIKSLKTGEIQAVIGTHAVVSDKYEFNNLGLAIIDEEQRFGVVCREKIKDKVNKNSIIYVSMTATPIPRTLATCIYGENTNIYSIKSMPNGRQSVDTVISNSFKVPDILKKELKEGRQGYVVCALIDENEDDEENTIVSVQATKKAYEKALPGYRVEVVTGKTKDADLLKIMEDFKNGSINVLISTTVIEVGVNNPNASVIVIQNAERFGLSTLHQLRGRVRRGTYKPYCILISEDVENERLKAICSTEDGFKLSMMDLDLRKSGNLIGLEQSGKNHFVELLISKPKTYEYAKSIAKEIIERNEHHDFIRIMDEVYAS